MNVLAPLATAPMALAQPGSSDLIKGKAIVYNDQIYMCLNAVWKVHEAEGSPSIAAKPAYEPARSPERPPCLLAYVKYPLST